MAQGNHQYQSKSNARSQQNVKQPQLLNRAAAQPTPLGRGFFMQMQRTVGNRATQAYANQLIQRNPDTLKERADVGAEVTSAFGESFGKRSDDLKDAYSTTKDAGTAQQSASMGAVSSTADLIGGPFQIMSAIRETLSISEDSDRTDHNKRWNYAGTGSQMIESSGKIVSGSAGLVDKASKSAGHTDGVGHSSAVSDYTGTVAEAISAVKSTIMAVKSIYDMYSQHSENGGLEKGEAAKGVITVISNAIQAASSGLKVAKGIMEIMESSTASLASVIPGVSIAVSGVKIALKTVDVIKAGLNRSAMTTLKRGFKDKYATSDFIKAKKWYRNAGVDTVKLAEHKRKLEAKKALGDADATRQLDEIAEYELAKEMKNINVKRTTRGGMQIGIELTKIAGDIATLTGVGAQVGTPLKIVASGVGAAMPLARSLKQAGRDRAAKAGSWGITKAIFNADKSTDKKLERRSRDSAMIIDMLQKLPAFDETDDKVVERYNQVKSLVEATGVSLFALEQFKTDPTKLKAKLIEEMGKRE
ncbi:hypothetical protein [Paenibacillus aestuarii]|uniref:Uncharacterized protein n=1 Tax=Paenibacillus aestuarii TaxID=516965 RepID=A0ABW0K8T4_9BACL|nr:hypothetical protein [Paenibacillus aestuarii]